MNYINSVEMLNATVTETANGAAMVFGDNIEGMIFTISSANTGGTSPTFDVKIQHSTNGTLWFDLVSFTQITGDTSELKDVTANILKHLRYVVTVGGTDTPTSDLVLVAAYNKTDKDN